jgi:dihydroorotate dehydrogenase
MYELASTNPYAITLAHPYIAAAGSLGFGIHTAAHVAAIGPAALITPTITAAGRSPDGPNRLFEHRGGLIYGEPWHDPGLEWVGRRCTSVWETWDIPVIVSLSGDDPDLLHCIRELNQVEGIAGFEVALTNHQLPTQFERVRSACDMPLLLKLPAAPPTMLAMLAQAAAAVGVDTLTLMGPAAVAGGSYVNPAFGALTLHAVQSLAGTTALEISACGGIHDTGTARSLLQSGARTIQLGSWLLRDPGCIQRLCAAN